MNYGVTIPDAEVLLVQGDRFIADNSQFGRFRVGAVLEAAAYYQNNINPALTLAKIANCTFDGGGQPGYGIIGCFETLTIKNCTFTGYLGAVPTGITWANDLFAGNPYLEYKGIPDGTPSAAILLKEMSAVGTLSDNDISNCENGILVWAGEKNFRHYAQIPYSNYVGLVSVGGTKVNDLTNAVKAYRFLKDGNRISLAEGSVGSSVLIENTADRYHRTTLYTQHYQIGTYVLTCEGQPAAHLEKDKTYTITVPVSTIAGSGDVDTYSAIVLRGGKGARADQGGTLLGSPEVELKSNQLELTFKVPENMTGKVYGSVIIWNDAKTYPEAEPVSFTLDIQ